MTDWILGFFDDTGYAGLAFLMWLENVFPPIPSELVMPLAGYGIARGDLGVVGVMVAGTLGSLLGAVMFYALGRRIGADRLRDWCHGQGRWMAVTPEDIDRANAWFERHGRLAVGLGRLVPGVRSLISIPAGVARQGVAEFLAYTTLGSVVWNALLVWGGYELGRRFETVGRYLDVITWIVVGALSVWYVRRVVRGR